MSIKEETTTAVAVMQAQLEIEFAHDGNRRVKSRPAPYVALPVIGGSDADVGETDVFVSQSWRDTWKPGPEICVYVGANEMWRSYAGTTRPPIYKVGVSSPERLYSRPRELTRDGYGAYHKNTAGDVVRDPSFGEWGVMALDDHLTLSPNSPVAIARRDIRVSLPAFLGLPEFDRRLRAALEPAGLTTWVNSDAGRAYCAARGLPVGMFDRVTQYPFGSSVRQSAAIELVIFRPRTETRRLALIIESIIAAKVTSA